MSIEKSAKEALLLIRSGKLPFNTNPPVTMGRIHKQAKGFWIYDNKRVLKVTAKRWTDLFKTAETTQLSNRGGRMVIGLSGIKDKEDMARIEEYVPDLIKEIITAAAPRNVGWTIGNFGYGRYVAPDGTNFDERSTVVQIAGLTSEQLKEVARALAEGLNQNSVLVFDDNTGQTFLQGKEQEPEPEPATA